MNEYEDVMIDQKKELEKYNQVGIPDRPLVNELIVKAKGPKRSMRQFAIDCGVSPSTFSRILQAESGAVSSDMLYRIASMADSDSDIDFETIMNANGMSKRKDDFFGDNEIDFDRKVRNILLSELFDRNVSILHLESVEDADHKRSLDYMGDVRVVTDAIPSLHYFKEDELAPEANGFTNWIFDICRSSSNLTCRQNAVRVYQRMLMVWGCYYSQQLGVDKISFVIADPEIYEELEVIIDDIVLRDWTSIILVDLEKGRVEKEYNIPIEGVKTIPEIFKIQPVVEEEEDIIPATDEEWHQFLGDGFGKRKW